MIVQSTFGAGHLMLTPLLVVCLDDVLRVPEIVQVAITAALPTIVLPLVIQPWAIFLDRHHVIVYRAVHAWIAVAGSLLLATAVLSHFAWLMWPGALLMGISLAAGSLGWSLGHNDFAPRGEETRYMALHVTLTGLRGLLAPPVVILAYHGLRQLGPGLEAWSTVLPVALLKEAFAGRNQDAGECGNADRRPRTRRWNDTTLVLWNGDGKIGWQLYDGQFRPLESSQSTTSHGKGAAGVALADGRFVVFR